MQLLVDNRQQLVVLVRVATEAYRHRTSVCRILPELSIHAHTICSALLLAHLFGVYATHYLRQNVELKVGVGSVGYRCRVYYVGLCRWCSLLFAEHLSHLSWLYVEDVGSRLAVEVGALLAW